MLCQIVNCEVVACDVWHAPLWGSQVLRPQAVHDSQSAESLELHYSSVQFRFCQKRVGERTRRACACVRAWSGVDSRGILASGKGAERDLTPELCLVRERIGML